MRYFTLTCDLEKSSFVGWWGVVGEWCKVIFVSEPTANEVKVVLSRGFDNWGFNTLSVSFLFLREGDPYKTHTTSLPPEISESLDGVSVSTSFAQSRVVSVSTSIKFPGLDESQSQHPRNFSVSMSRGLNIQEISQS